MFSWIKIVLGTHTNLCKNLLLSLQFSLNNNDGMFCISMKQNSNLLSIIVLSHILPKYVRTFLSRYKKSLINCYHQLLKIHQRNPSKRHMYTHFQKRLEY